MKLYQLIKENQESLYLNIEAIESVEATQEGIVEVITHTGAHHSIVAQTLMMAFEHAGIGMMSFGAPEEAPAEEPQWEEVVGDEPSLIVTNK